MTQLTIELKPYQVDLITEAIDVWERSSQVRSVEKLGIDWIDSEISNLECHSLDRHQDGYKQAYTSICERIGMAVVDQIYQKQKSEK